MTGRIYLIDAFAEGPFTGNPAAVCLLDAPRPVAWMQALASEMNQAETAFVHWEGSDPKIRWFSPTVEIALCGHATMAAAHALWESGLQNPAQPIAFGYSGGTLCAQRMAAREDWIELDFPTLPGAPYDTPEGLEAILGVPISQCLRSPLDTLVRIEDESILRTLRPDLQGIARLPGRGLIVTAPSREAGIDFVSRFFAPQSGIDEDPVTGSAHCTLGPYWARHLGRTELRARQVSPRGGLLELSVGSDRIQLRGRAFTVAEGTLMA
jgi:predicted PhzF superfamily epimerase YddE/YHI9